MKSITPLLLLVALLSFTSCGYNSSKKDKSSPDTELLQKTSGTLVLNNATFAIPEGWKKVNPTSQMRIAELALEDTPGEMVAVFHFGEQDMKQQNIDRWKGQFTEIESYEELPCKVKQITALKITGTYKKKAFPMAQDFTATPGYGTLAAIVPAENGPYYLKLDAPVEVIDKEQARFIAFLNSFQAQ